MGYDPTQLLSVDGGQHISIGLDMTIHYISQQVKLYRRRGAWFTLMFIAELVHFTPKNIVQHMLKSKGRWTEVIVKGMIALMDKNTPV